MDDFLALTQADPRQMSGLLAKPETWKVPATAVATRTAARRTRRHARRRAHQSGPQAAKRGSCRCARAPGTSLPTRSRLKLYQPAHQRFYLVAACLVCRTPGLPDRPLEHQRAGARGFVVRRLVPRCRRGSGESAIRRSAPSRHSRVAVGARWPSPASFVAGEELLPLSPLAYEELDGRRRRLFNGLIPVAKRGNRSSARRSRECRTPAAAATRRSTRAQMLLKSEVLGPWKPASRRSRTIAKASITKNRRSRRPRYRPREATPPSPRPTGRSRPSRGYVLLDFAECLERPHPGVVGRDRPAQSSAGLSAPTYDRLPDELAANQPSRASPCSSRSKRDSRASRDTPRKWSSQSTAADTTAQSAVAGYFLLRHRAPHRTNDRYRSRKTLRRGHRRRAASRGALPTDDSCRRTAPPLPWRRSTRSTSRHRWFTVRCVFERPRVRDAGTRRWSATPTASFQLAAFFDPDAPARPIRDRHAGRHDAGRAAQVRQEHSVRDVRRDVWPVLGA